VSLLAVKRSADGGSGTSRRRARRPGARPHPVFRTVSLGICTIRLDVLPDLLDGPPVGDRERPEATAANGPLMARGRWGELRITSVFRCVARGPRAWPSFMFAACCWRELMAVGRHLGGTLH
jgi:hypothetical protein